ncbi:ACP S-malonyltransferase [Bdellovibrio sp. HCB185ZH]|uniref:ACP S-malonyltransferase n=1 Tax=Bdellovibrio sp. HCB185ZH TaxID=3394235 RepID=UPI0039A5EA26
MFTLVFPGQGSQQPGMGRFLFDNFKIAQETFEEGSEALKQDMKKLCFEGTEADLALTENTQPALLLVSTATQRVLRSEFGLKVQSAAGHSIGEYAALVAADVIRFEQGMQAVRTRGQAMQSAVPVGQGGMVAVLGLEPEQVETLCQWTVKNSGFGPLSPANFNSPGQIVISGSMKAINWLKDNFKPEAIWAEAPKRAKLIPLVVSAPFHCEMMKPAEDTMRLVLTAMEFKTAAFPVVQNFHAKFETDGAVLRENLIRQVSAPVRWMQSMDTLKASGHSQVIECGAGKVIQGLLKKIDGEFFKVMTTTSMEDLKTIEDFLKATSH